MSEMPERIWAWILRRQGEPLYRKWYVYNHQVGDTEYIRADLYAQLEAENAALSARVADCEADRDSWRQQAEQHADLALKLAEGVAALQAELDTTRIALEQVLKITAIAKEYSRVSNIYKPKPIPGTLSVPCINRNGGGDRRSLWLNDYPELAAYLREREDSDEE